MGSATHQTARKLIKCITAPVLFFERGHKTKKMTNYNFEVETIEAGQRQSYGDSYYHYKVTTERDEHDAKAFCMNVLRKSYKRDDMPNPFAGKLIEFKKLTDNNNGKGFLDDKVAETYSYKLSTEYTG